MSRAKKIPCQKSDIKEYADIGKRLRLFLEEKFGTVYKSAAHLNMKPNDLYPYTRGVKRPGGIVMERLRKVGANIGYIMTGEVGSGPPGVSEMSPEYRVDRVSELEKRNKELEDENAALRGILAPEALSLIVEAVKRKKRGKSS